MKTACLTSIGLSLLFLAPGACKAKEKEDAPTATTALETPAAPVPASTAVPVPAAPTPVPATLATEAERELAKPFIESFLAAIETGDASHWPALHTTARRELLVANDAVDKSYEAWRKGTVTAIPLIRAADFALEKAGEGFRLRFLGVKVPTDPDAEYTITVAIEDGEMRINEK